jgi:hypothetical protein
MDNSNAFQFGEKGLTNDAHIHLGLKTCSYLYWSSDLNFKVQYFKFGIILSWVK